MERPWSQTLESVRAGLKSAILLGCCCSDAQSCPTFATSWTVTHQVPLSMGFSQQEYWSEFPFPPPGDLPHPGTELVSPTLGGGFFTTSATWEAQIQFILLDFHFKEFSFFPLSFSLKTISPVIYLHLCNFLIQTHCRKF